MDNSVEKDFIKYLAKKELQFYKKLYTFYESIKNEVNRVKTETNSWLASGTTQADKFMNFVNDNSIELLDEDRNIIISLCNLVSSLLRTQSRPFKSINTMSDLYSELGDKLKLKIETLNSLV